MGAGMVACGPYSIARHANQRFHFDDNGIVRCVRRHGTEASLWHQKFPFMLVSHCGHFVRKRRNHPFHALTAYTRSHRMVQYIHRSKEITCNYYFVRSSNLLNAYYYHYYYLYIYQNLNTNLNFLL